MIKKITFLLQHKKNASSHLFVTTQHPYGKLFVNKA